MPLGGQIKPLPLFLQLLCQVFGLLKELRSPEVLRNTSQAGPPLGPRSLLPFKDLLQSPSWGEAGLPDLVSSPASFHVHTQGTG